MSATTDRMHASNRSYATTRMTTTAGGVRCLVFQTADHVVSLNGMPVKLSAGWWSLCDMMNLMQVPDETVGPGVPTCLWCLAYQAHARAARHAKGNET